MPLILLQQWLKCLFKYLFVIEDRCDLKKSFGWITDRLGSAKSGWLCCEAVDEESYHEAGMKREPTDLVVAGTLPTHPLLNIAGRTPPSSHRAIFPFEPGELGVESAL